MAARNPILVAFVGPNGAGKTTLRNLLFANSKLPFINADLIAAASGLDPYQAAAKAETERQRLVAAGCSFMFESVLSDPVGAKVDFLRAARAAGYLVIVHFVGLDSPERSRARVIQRVHEGGHDVPDDKLTARFPRVLENLRRLPGAVDDLTIYDNSSAEVPYRVLARFAGSQLVALSVSLPRWITDINLPFRRTRKTLRLG